VKWRDRGETSWWTCLSFFPWRIRKELRDRVFEGSHRSCGTRVRNDSSRAHYFLEFDVDESGCIQIEVKASRFSAPLLPLSAQLEP